MNRVCGQVLVGLTVAACGGIIVSACTHDDTTIFVRDVLAAQPVAVGQQCSFTSDPTQPFIESGILDVSFREEYTATFLVGNQMVPEGNPSTPATETSFVNIQGAIVRITDADGNPITSFTTLAGVTIPPAVGTTPTYAPIEVTIVNQTTVSNPAFLNPIKVDGDIDTLITYTRFFGKTLGGLSVESNEFEFPVEVCRSCLISFPITEASPFFKTPNCRASGVTTSTSTLPVPCVFGQDSTVDCGQCLQFADCLGSDVPTGGPADAATE